MTNFEGVVTTLIYDFPLIQQDNLNENIDIKSKYFDYLEFIMHSND
jgi:hypothetical protein